jgi:hypothetical protein
VPDSYAATWLVPRIPQSADKVVNFMVAVVTEDSWNESGISKYKYLLSLQ